MDDDDQYHLLKTISRTAEMNAVEKACKLLDAPSELANVAELKEVYTRQKAKAKNQMETIYAQQIDESNHALELMYEASQHLQNIRDFFTTIQIKCDDNLKLIDNYNAIRDTLRTLINIKNTRNSLDQLLSLDATIEDIQEMLEDSDDGRLLEAHEKISQLEEIRDSALSQIESGANYDIPREVFDKYFRKIDDIGDKFTAVLWNCVLDVISVCEENPALMVRVLRVIEREEESDAKIRLNAQLNDGSSKLAKTKERNYKKKLLDNITNHVIEKFEDVIKEEPNVKGKIAAIQQLLEEDLLDKVPDYVQDCFPPHYDIVNFYANLYQDQVIKFVKDMMDKRHKIYSGYPMSEKLKLVKWLQGYSELMEEIMTTPHNFSKDCENIIGDYVSSRTTFMIEVCTNIINQDFRVENMDNMHEQFNSNERGYPYTPAPVEMFSLLNTHIDEVVNSGIKQLLPLIVDACRATIRLYQNTLVDLIQSSLSSLNAVILSAMTNNCTQCITFTSEFEERLDDLIGSDMISHVNFDEVRKGFEQKGEIIVDTCLAEMVWGDVEPLMKELFDMKSGVWLQVKASKDDYLNTEEDSDFWSEAQKRSPVTKVVMILRDFFEKYFEKTLLESQWLERLSTLICKRVVKKYLEMFVNLKKPHKFSNSATFLKQMGYDVKRLRDFFLEEITIVEMTVVDNSDSEEEVDYGADEPVERSTDRREEVNIEKTRVERNEGSKILRPLELLYNVVKSEDADDLSMELSQLLTFYPDASQKLITTCLHFRADLTKQQKKDFEIALKTVYDNHKYNPQIYSIFSELEGKKPSASAISPTQVAEPKSEQLSEPSSPVPQKKKHVKSEDDDIIVESLDDFLND
jgi:hypothetical protein